MSHSVLRVTSAFGRMQGLDMYLLLLFFLKLFKIYDNAVHVTVKVLIPLIIKYFTFIIIIFYLLT
jgi:hypothetical protein